MDKEKRPEFDWRTAAGREVRQRLDAWGDREWIIHLGGDAALTSASGGGGHGKPGDMPEFLLRALDIDASLKAYGADQALQVTPLLRHAFVFCRRDENVRIEYVLKGGERVLLGLNEPEPARFIASQFVHGRERKTIEWDRYVDPELDRVIGRYVPVRRPERLRLVRRNMLEFMVTAFGAFAAGHLNLGEFAKPERAA